MNRELIETYITPLFRTFPLDENEVKAGVAQLLNTIERLALEAEQAELSGLPFWRAVRSHARLPTLGLIHQLLEDVLTLELSDELTRWLRGFLDSADPESVDEGRTALVCMASGPVHDRWRSLARFVVFEGVRINLLLSAKMAPEAVFGVGVDAEDLDRLAERDAEDFIERPCNAAGVRPFHLMVATAQLRLNAECERLRQKLAWADRSLRELYERRALLERALVDVDARKAVLIRNAAGPSIEVQQLTIERLQERHIVLADVPRNTLDQRRRRAAAKGVPELARKGVALIDLVASRTEKESTNDELERARSMGGSGDAVAQRAGRRRRASAGVHG